MLDFTHIVMRESEYQTPPPSPRKKTPVVPGAPTKKSVTKPLVTDMKNVRKKLFKNDS